jgi:hypothetical protein
MICLWASLSGKVCEMSLMNKMRPSLLMSPIGMDALMSCVRSIVRQFLSFVFKQCSLYSWGAGDMRSIVFGSARSSISELVILSGISKYLLRKLNGSEVSSEVW